MMPVFRVVANVPDLIINSANVGGARAEQQCPDKWMISGNRT